LKPETENFSILNSAMIAQIVKIYAGKLNIHDGKNSLPSNRNNGCGYTRRRLNIHRNAAGILPLPRPGSF